MKYTLYLQAIFFSLLFLGGNTESAWALQSHGEPEGLYVHQMAHLLFIITLAFLYWHTRKTPAVISKGWRYLQIFCILLICWNSLAFIGHEAYEHLSPGDFLERYTWKEQLAMPLTFVKMLYFVTKMDHLLKVPALLALVISLRTFYLEARNKGGRK